jgi:serine/threonine protein kinase
MQPECYGRYVLLDRIAAGGMGEVFAAVPVNLWGFDKFFALKRILPSLTDDVEFLQRFRDEVRLVLPMNHPNVVQVFEVGRVGAELFIVMELVQGRDLRQIMSRLFRWRRERELPIAAALYLVREILTGLDYCHRHKDAVGRGLGVVHRDVCPSNVLVSYDGNVKLADFGIALSEMKLSRTDPRHTLGHLGYIAPESVRGEDVDHRADIYSAGVILFELLTGQRFVASEDLGAILELKRVRSAVRPSELRADVPPFVDALVSWAVAVDPERRFASARQYLEQVQGALTRIDPLFTGATLAEVVLSRVYQQGERRRRLSDLIRKVDLNALQAQQQQQPHCRSRRVTPRPSARTAHGSVTTSSPTSWSAPRGSVSRPWTGPSAARERASS